MTDIAHLRRAVGKKVVDHDVATEAPVRLMQSTFARRDGEPAPGTEIPPGWHLLYFLPNFTIDELGPDGLPLSTGVLPRMPFPRRMFAGQRIRFHRPIRVGDQLRRETELLNIDIKDGGTGRLGIATVVSRIYGPEGMCVEEEKDSVFREAVPPGASSQAPKREAPPADTVWERIEHPNEIMLFRFSALTFNSHRIHYDPDYARGEEGYPALVVHGPLSMTYLIHFAIDMMPGRRLTSFAMRARAPLFVDAPVRLVGRPTADGKGAEVWAATPAGTVAMSATATFG